MTDTRKNQEQEELSYISGAHSSQLNHRWRANPADPYIYISFSAEDFHRTYGQDVYVNDAFKKWTIRNHSHSVINFMTTLIQEEWGDKAKLPIKFLPPNTNPNVIKNKNVCFILRHRASYLESLGSHEFGFNTVPPKHSHAAYKFILTPNLEGVEITNEIKKKILHEVGHGVAELKHPKQYTLKDEGSFGEVDCGKTVMGYEDLCEVARLKGGEVFGTRIEKNNPDPDFQRKYKEVANAFPGGIGSLDIAAAKEFRRNWKKRNENMSSQQINQTPKVELYFSDAIVDYTKKSNMTALAQNATISAISSKAFIEEISSQPSINVNFSAIANSVFPFGLFAASKLGHRLNQALGEIKWDNDISENAAKESATAIMLLKNNQLSFDDALIQLCGRNNVKKYPDKVDIVKTLLIRFMNNETSSEVNKECFRIDKIQNRNLRFKELVKLSKVDAQAKIKNRFG